MRSSVDVALLAVAFVTIGVPLVAAVGGGAVGSLLNATLTARASQRELEQADQHDIVDRLRKLELQESRRQGREDTERQNQ